MKCDSWRAGTEADPGDGLFTIWTEQVRGADEPNAVCSIPDRCVGGCSCLYRVPQPDKPRTV